MIFEMKPLTDPELRRVITEVSQRALGRTVFAQEPHVEMTVIRGTFGFAVTGGGGPGARQVEQAVPMNPIGPAEQQLSRATQAELLHFLGTEARDARFGDPNRKIRHCPDFREL